MDQKPNEQHEEKSKKSNDPRPMYASSYGLNAAPAWKSPETDPETMRRYVTDRLRHFASR